MEKIIDSNLLDQYTKDMLSYAVAVNRRRSIPEVRDGFKPVQRRILFSAHELNLVEPKLKKSANIVGYVMGYYHPHGDSSIYDAMPLMGNSHSTKLPLLYLSGNWGTVMGDSQAAMRYTECSLSKFANKYIIGELNDVDNVVDWEKNFDDTRNEPVYLPVQLPILLINGASGMGVGLACEVPRHNPIDVLDVTISLINDIINKEDTTSVILVPDQCQRTEVIDTNWKEIADTGEGKFVVRGIIEIGELNGYPALFVKSLPDRVYSTDVTDAINEMIEKKQLTMIKDITDISKTTVNIVIQLQKDANPQYVRDILYKRTNIEKSFMVNMELVEDINPRKFSYKEYLVQWIAHRCITKKRLYTAKKYEVDTRLHKISTFIQVIESGDIDYITDKIKKNTKDDDTELIEYMVRKFKFTTLQCSFIINSPLKFLSLAKLNAYKAEREELQEASIYYEERILDHSITLTEIKQELEEIRAYIMKDKNLRERKTKIIKDTNGDIPEGEFLVVVTMNNYIRKLPVSANITKAKNDQAKVVVKVDNRDSLLVFGNKGKVYKLPVYKIPVCSKTDTGVMVASLIKSLTSDILTILPDSVVQNALKLDRKPYFVITTEDKLAKRLQMEDFATVSLSGIMYTKLSSPNDRIVDIVLVDESSDIVFYSGRKALRLHASEIPLYRRSAQGVVVMKSADTTDMEGMGIIYPDTDSVVVVTANGKINKFSIMALENGKRAGAGSSVIKLGKTDSIFKIFGVNDSYMLKVYTVNGIIDIPVSEIPSSSSASMGSKLIPMKGNKILRVEALK